MHNTTGRQQQCGDPGTPVKDPRRADHSVGPVVSRDKVRAGAGQTVNGMGAERMVGTRALYRPDSLVKS